VRQLATVTPVGLDPVAIFLGDEAWWSHYAGNAMRHQAVMKPEPKISGFIDRLQLVTAVARQYSLQRFPGPWDAAAEHLDVEGPDGYVPPMLMQVVIPRLLFPDAWVVSSQPPILMWLDWPGITEYHQPIGQTELPFAS